MKKVYLAGGFKSNWQSTVVSNIEAEWYNPREKEVEKILSPLEYGTWDLHYIKQCDIVLAYMERTNSSGIGMSVEIGYAKGLGKTVILCLEENNQHIKDSYLEFMKLAADITFTNLQEAVEYLKLFKQ